jgi:DNA-binding MarR family transcriptional regulator
MNHLNRPVIGYPGPVTEEANRAGEEPPVEWLTAGELESWLSLVRLMTWLPWSLDQQLQRDSKLGMVEYAVLAMLSQSPERTLRMSSLAVLTNASLSRLSHLVKRLEERGLVRREPDPADGRFTHAILTEEGFQTLAEAAPGHVAHVRSLVIDVLSPEQLRRMGRAAERIMSRIDTSAIN